MKHAISVRRLTNPHLGWSAFLRSYRSLYEYPIHCQSGGFLIKRSHSSPSIMLTIVCRIVKWIWAHTPISPTHVFWVSVLISPLTIHHSCICLFKIRSWIRHIYLTQSIYCYGKWSIESIWSWSCLHWSPNRTSSPSIVTKPGDVNAYCL
jgi:hypothetical protein